MSQLIRREFLFSKKIKMLSRLVFLLIFIPGIIYAVCGTSCEPCGEVSTNALPGYNDTPQVQPFQNFLATYQGCGVVGGWNGFFLGTGFGYGRLNLGLTVPGIDFVSKQKKYNYITEYATLGYAHVSGRFFIGVELGYYYNAVGNPIFYNDELSSITITLPPSPLIAVPDTIIITPDSVRIDINAQNHVAVDLLPGFALTPCFTAFARLGAEYTRYSWNRRIAFPAPLVIVLPNFPPPPFFQVFDSATNLQEVEDGESAPLVSGRVGAGLSYAIAQHVNFVVNYIHKFGRRATFHPNSSLIIDSVTRLEVPLTVVSDIPTLTVQNTIKPTVNEILFGINFSF